MKYTIIAFAAMFIMSCNKEAQTPYFTEAVPPPITTTYDKALADYNAGVTNEGWANYQYNNRLFVVSFYLTTADGLTRMFAAYDGLVRNYQTVTDKDGSRFEIGVSANDMLKLALSIKNGKSAITKYAEVNGKVVVSITMGNSSIMILLR